MPDQHLPANPERGDRFIEAGQGAVEFLEQHIRLILTLIALAILSGVAWASFSQWSENRRAEDQARVADIAVLYPGKGGGVLDADLTKAIERYEAFIAESPTATALAHARLNLGLAYEEAGETDKAKAVYEALRDAPELYAASAGMRLGYLAAAAGDTVAAGAEFEKVAQNHPGLAPQAALEIGVLAEAAGQTEAAIELYRAVANQYAFAPQSSEAKARIRHLGGDPDEGLVPETPVIMEGAEGAAAGEAAPADSEAGTEAAPETSENKTEAPAG